MATKYQQSQPSGQVVSVRLPPDIIKRIDALAEHTGRSRGVYIRLALSALLPQLDKDHWNQKTVRYEQDGFDREFQELMMHHMEEPDSSL